MQAARDDGRSASDDHPVQRQGRPIIDPEHVLFEVIAESGLEQACGRRPFSGRHRSHPTLADTGDAIISPARGRCPTA